MDLPTQLLSSLQAQDLPLPSPTWLASLIAARNPPPPLASLVATARARLLASDLTTPGLLDASYATSHSLPPAAAAAAVAVALPRAVVVQVLDLEDVSRSRWEQVEELEAIERGEGTRGRRVVRLPVGGDGEGEHGDGEEGNDRQGQGRGPGAAPVAAGPGAGGARNATHKLVLQDARGQKVFALELKRVGRIGVGMTNIGEKILLKRGATLARGVVMLEPSTCTVLGGKVDAWQKPWLEGRLARLREAALANGPE